MGLWGKNTAIKGLSKVRTLDLEINEFNRLFYLSRLEISGSRIQLEIGRQLDEFGYGHLR